MGNVFNHKLYSPFTLMTAHFLGNFTITLTKFHNYISHIKDAWDLKFLTSFFFWPGRTACGILALLPGIKLKGSAVRAQSPNHWTTREFPKIYIPLKEKNKSFRMNLIPVLLVITASLSLVKTFYNRIAEPSSFFSSTFCLTYLHVAYNKQKMDLLYPI